MRTNARFVCIGNHTIVDLAVGDRSSARFRVLFGQPVKLGGASFGVVRIALGADMLVDSFCSGNPPTAGEASATAENSAMDRLLAQVNIVLMCGLAALVRCCCHRFTS